MPKRECPGDSVGAIIKNEEVKILLLERLTYPLGWALPAGHRDNEVPEEQAKREVAEEVCLIVKKLKLILGPIKIMNQCSRPKNSEIKYNCHNWWVYEALDWQGEPSSGEPDKIGRVEWFDIAQIKDLNLDPAWEILFQKLKLL